MQIHARIGTWGGEWGYIINPILSTHLTTYKANPPIISTIPYSLSLKQKHNYRSLRPP